FYKDGVREVTLLPGIEDGELTRLLSVLQRARQLRVEGDDLLTILWEEQLQFLRYEYVDLLAESVDLPEPGPGHTADELLGVLEAELPDEAEEEEDEDAPESGALAEPDRKPVSQEDFNPTLYSLDAREMERLRQDVEAEMARDLRGDVLAALFDRLEEPDHPERQGEILGIFRQLLPNFLGRGALEGATRILEELQALERREGILGPEWRDEAARLLDDVSTSETMEELIRALEDGSLRPDPKRLGAFLRFLRGGALGPLIHASETIGSKELQPVLREAVHGIAERNRDALFDLLHADDPVLLAGAARLAGRMRRAEAGPILADLMSDEDPGVRLAAVEAATDLKASTAAGSLERLLDDPARDVRVAAVRALGRLRYAPAAGVLADVLTSRALRNADLSEKIAFFESYGLLGGDDAVDLLDRFLNGRGFLGRRENAELRACAALGLGKVNSPLARSALQAGLNEEDPVVRSAVNRALRGEE
ncbi:MAG TPA: HEAT repeat domain-containing protein, partial [Longimicrobiales bacterium]|nr:HEAT repeat domain-containing protein [Longimicrobiales bacterium]